MRAAPHPRPPHSSRPPPRTAESPPPSPYTPNRHGERAAAKTLPFQTQFHLASRMPHRRLRQGEPTPPEHHLQASRNQSRQSGRALLVRDSEVLEATAATSSRPISR